MVKFENNELSITSAIIWSIIVEKERERIHERKHCTINHKIGNQQYL